MGAQTHSIIKTRNFPRTLECFYGFYFIENRFENSIPIESINT